MTFELKLNRRRTCVYMAGAGVLPAVCAGQVRFPSKPLRIVVPFAAGGGNDMVARLVAAQLTASLGQAVVVENRAGAGGNLGIEFVAKAPPDGYTLVHATNGLAMSPCLFKRLPFDISKDLEPVAFLASTPVLILVHPASGIRTLAQLLQEGRSRPRSLAYATPGVGTPHHFAMELLASRAGVEWTHVAYKGAAPALVDVVAGREPVLVSTPASVTDFIATGRLRVLATMEAKRPARFADVPTIAELFPDFEVNIAHGLMTPAGTPANVIDSLAEVARRATADPAFQQKLAAVGFVAHYQSGTAVRHRLTTELEIWKAVAARAGIVPE